MEGENRINLYRECLRNHAASLGSYATDGCGEFTLDQTSPASLLCVACGCHRNFHRKIKDGGGYSNRGIGQNQVASVELMDYIGGSGSGGRGRQVPEAPDSENPSNKKRLRSKFTPEQKEKMLAFAEKLGWKLTRKEKDDEVEKFCNGIAVTRKSFKVWMHNHKGSSSTSTGNASTLTDQ